jgi:hypothetical protein
MSRTQRKAVMAAGVVIGSLTVVQSVVLTLCGLKYLGF